MTIDEKLQHFYEVSLDEAREDAAQAIHCLLYTSDAADEL